MTSAPRPTPDDGWRGCDPTDPRFLDDPHTPLARLREEAPVFRTPRGPWLLSRYDDIVRLLKSVRCGARTTDGRIPGVVESPDSPLLFLFQQDPPVHTRLRRMLSPTFRPGRVEQYRDAIAAHVDRLLDACEERGEMDVIADLAQPVAETVICRILGVPLDDAASFSRWASDVTHGLAVATGGREELLRAWQAFQALSDRFRRLIAELGARPRDDLLSRLARPGPDGARLDDLQIVCQAVGIFGAGLETTLGLIGNGAASLARNPGALDRLRSRPELAGPCVEECLRYEPPILCTGRILHEPATFGERVLAPDTHVEAALAAGNRDPARFREPDRFDIERPDNRHLSFGGGAHFCLGAHLARLQAGITFTALARRFADVALARERLDWSRSLFRVPARVPLLLRTRAPRWV